MTRFHTNKFACTILTKPIFFCVHTWKKEQATHCQLSCYITIRYINKKHLRTLTILWLHCKGCGPQSMRVNTWRPLRSWNWQFQTTHWTMPNKRSTVLRPCSKMTNRHCGRNNFKPTFKTRGYMRSLRTWLKGTDSLKAIPNRSKIVLLKYWISRKKLFKQKLKFLFH